VAGESTPSTPSAPRPAPPAPAAASATVPVAAAHRAIPAPPTGRDRASSARPARAPWGSFARRRAIVARGAAAVVAALVAAVGLARGAGSDREHVVRGIDRVEQAVVPAGGRQRPAAGPGRPLPAAVDAIDAEDRALLRAVFGIADPARLRASDTGRTAVLLYDAVPAGCAAAATSGRGGRTCRPVTVRVGLASPRRVDETWDAFVGRVRRGGPRAWPAAAHEYYTGLASLDPRARPAFERLVVDARRAGFDVRIAETYRSPERQALLVSRADGRTETATSVHSYGRAADLVVGDGRIDRPATARAWIAFRRWVVRYRGGRFRLVGTPERTWDWPHVELATPVLGFGTLADLVGRCPTVPRRTPDMPSAAVECTLRPALPAHVAARHGAAPPAVALRAGASPTPGDASAAAGQ
jgi:hypothetical protein